MKTTLSIQTLSPIHIGSGQELLPGTEYLAFQEENVVAVVAPEKVLKALNGHEYIDQWVSL
ncbi:MAG: hypothetical protein AAF985_27515, partial [Bacteroidota bacterium]